MHTGRQTCLEPTAALADMQPVALILRRSGGLKDCSTPAHWLRRLIARPRVWVGVEQSLRSAVIEQRSVNGSFYHKQPFRYRGFSLRQLPFLAGTRNCLCPYADGFPRA